MTGPVCEAFAESAGPQAIDPYKMSRQIVSTGEWDQATIAAMNEQQLGDMTSRMDNILNRGARMADDTFDRIERGDEQRTPERLEDYYSKGERIFDPGMREAIVSFAQGDVTRAEADQMIQDRLEHWQQEIPAQIQAAQDCAAEMGPQADAGNALQRTMTIGMGTGLG